MQHTREIGIRHAEFVEQESARLEVLRVFVGALRWYLPEHDTARGCLPIGTAAVAAVKAAAVKARVRRSLRIVSSFRASGGIAVSMEGA